MDKHRLSYQGFSKEAICVSHHTPKEEGERGAAGPARRATLSLFRFCRRRRPALALQWLTSLSGR